MKATEIKATRDDDIEGAARQDGEGRHALDEVHIAGRFAESGVQDDDGKDQRHDQHIDRIKVRKPALRGLGASKCLFAHATGLCERAA
jgi:hypothetical protein